MIKRFLVLLGLSLLFLSGCQSPAPMDGLGGTGQKVVDGLGGTGQKVADGLGGTGQKVADGIGGTGIVGTITDFGSIWINNAHVHFDRSAAISRNGESVSAGDFLRGQVVAVLSDPTRNGYQARRIDIVHEVSGPVSGVDLKLKHVSLLNQIVRVTSDTRVALMDGQSVKLDVLPNLGHIRVSGLRQKDGTIVASRIDQIAPTNLVELIGQFSNSQIAGQPVVFDESLAFDAEADRLLVRGEFRDGVIHADAITKDAILQVIEQATDLLLEGFLFDQPFDGDIVVGGIDIVLPDDFELDPNFDFDGPVFVEAELGDDDLFYTEDLYLPEGIDDLMDYEPEFEEYYEEEEVEIILN